MAKAILAKYGCDMDFDAQFLPEDRDLMRPKGGKYPGVSKEVDRSLADESEGSSTAESSSSSTNQNPANNDSPLDAANILRFDAQAVLAEERAAYAASVADVNPEGHSIWINLTEDGQKKAHKKTVLRTFMDPTLDVNDGKSHDRFLRVRYFHSINGDSWDRKSSTVYSKSTAENHLLKIQGLFATLVCFNTSKVSLAVLQCTGIKIVNTGPATYLEAGPIAEISLPDTRYEITGQILSLVPFVDASDASGNMSWAWVAQFVAFESAKAKKASAADAPARMRHLNITVDGRLVLPLRPTELKQATLEDILNIPPNASNDSEKTWVFSNTQLDDMSATLLDRVNDEDVRLKIPVYGPVKEGRYPYEAVVKDDTNATSCTISHCLNSVKAPAAKDGRRPCRICQKNISGSDRQNHVGRHIFLSQRGVVEENNAAEVAKDYPCGFCGQAMADGACDISIASGKAISSCSEWYQFQIKAALKRSDAKPSTNTPLKCPLCPQVHWKYNMAQHLQDKHPTWDVVTEESQRRVLRTMITLSDEEQIKLGVPPAKSDSQTHQQGLHGTTEYSKPPFSKFLVSRNPGTSSDNRIRVLQGAMFSHSNGQL
ncbi:hypothetical protein C8R44DRAFT_877797 [Mycena epipterygia]|nr:hypothetical protein C8R44DRAFT_877797 [Mycena epipterygia]